MTDSPIPLSAFACFYLLLTPRQRKIFQYLRWYRNKYPKSFPRMTRIAKFCGMSVRGIQKFFATLESKGIKENYLTIIPRFENGHRTTNQYVLNINFKLAMDWLEIHHKLNTHRRNTESVIVSMQNEEKVHHPPPQKFTPLSKDSSFRKDLKELPKKRMSVNPNLREIRIEEDIKIYASQVACDYEIVETLEACRYKEKNGGVSNPTGYFFGTLRNIVKKHRGIRI